LIYPSPNSRNKTEASGNSHLSEKWNLIADDESATGLTNRTFPARIFAYEAIDINKHDRMNVIECRYPSPLLQRHCRRYSRELREENKTKEDKNQN